MQESSFFMEQASRAFLDGNAMPEFEESLKAATLDWPTIWKMVGKHKLQPILHKVLQNIETPNAIPGQAQRNRHKMQQLQRSLFKLKELQRAIAAFTTAGIKVKPYKGLAFAQSFYGDLSLRVSVDIDLAIALPDIPASFAVMKSLGYVEYSKEKQGASIEGQSLKKTRAYQIDYSWVLYEGEKIICNIELHWQPGHPVLQIPLTFEGLPEAAYDEMKLAGRMTPVFSKPYQAIFTIIHHGLIDTWGQYRHVLDFAMILKGLTKPEYEMLKGLLKEHKLQQCFYVGLYLVEELYAVSLPGENYPKSKYKKIGDQLIDGLRKGNLAGNWSENKYKLLLHLRMRDSWYEKLRTVISLVWFKLRF